MEGQLVSDLEGTHLAGVGGEVDRAWGPRAFQDSVGEYRRVPKNGPVVSHEMRSREPLFCATYSIRQQNLRGVWANEPESAYPPAWKRR
jgi:hypothetical protein